MTMVPICLKTQVTLSLEHRHNGKKKKEDMHWFPTINLHGYCYRVFIGKKGKS